MNNFFDNLYNKFLLRDLLGKALPGLILLLGLTIILGHGSFRVLSSFRHITIFHYFLLYGLSFAVGMLLQSGSIVRFLWRRRKKVDGLAQLTNYSKFLKKQATTFKEKNAVGLLIAQTIVAQRERLVVLKDMTGNLGMSFFLLSLVALCKQFFGIGFGLFAVSGFLFWESWWHTDEQKQWEDDND